MRVAIGGELLPHYRKDVFAALDSSNELEMTFIAGSRVRDGSIPTIPFSALKRTIPVKNRYCRGLLWQHGLLKAIVRGRFDAVVLAGDVHHLSTWVTAAIARMLGTRVLFWTIGWREPDRGLTRILRLAFYRIAHTLLLYGQNGRAIGRRAGYPDRRMRVIYNSSSVGPDCPGDNATRISGCDLPPEGKKVATAVVRLTERRKLHQLLVAAQAVNQTGRNLAVLLVGEGSDRQNLVDHASVLGVELYSPGAVYDEKSLEMVYDRTTVTVVPGFVGLTVLQSFRHGKPVITNDDDSAQGPETEAIVDGVTGSRFRSDDIGALISAIIYWIDLDEERRRDAAVECRLMVSQKWSADSQADRIAKVILNSNTVISAGAATNRGSDSE